LGANFIDLSDGTTPGAGQVSLRCDGSMNGNRAACFSDSGTHVALEDANALFGMSEQAFFQDNDKNNLSAFGLYIGPRLAPNSDGANFTNTYSLALSAPDFGKNRVALNVMNGGLAVFSGNVNVAGSLSVSGSKNFKIDHPLDPANKYLYHASVESPDMMDIYNGMIALDAHGTAWVQLPNYFEALNRDFRYQLTSIGTAQPMLHVGTEISQNRFKIAGGKPGAKVSWQVTGVRRDAYAQAHPFLVEENKPAGERGHYLTPALFGHPEQAIDAVPAPADSEAVALEKPD
jgi:hypothetical protein